MTNARLVAQYGFGAARLALPASPHASASSAAGLRTALRELGSAGGLCALLRGGAFAGAAFALLLALASVFDEPSEREMVWLEPPAELLVEIASLAPDLPEKLPPPEAALPEPELPPPAQPLVARAVDPAPARLVSSVPPPAPEAARTVREPVRPVIAPEPLRVAALPLETVVAPRVAPRRAPPRAMRTLADLAAPLAPPLALAASPELSSRAPRRERAGESPRAASSRPQALVPPRFAQASPGSASPAPSSGRALAPTPPPPASPSVATPASSKLQGVSLAALAACLSDREEDALRQRVVASVPRPEECTSEAGTWRFVETKNVNAFLLWVERSPMRRAGDRCEELTLALDCLARGMRRELHEG